MAERTFSLLIVSPDRTLLRRLTRFLDVFGYEVRQAVQTLQAEAAVEAGRVDFLVVDSALGKQTAQICRAVRRGPGEGYTYALLLAQDPESSELTEALDGGFDDFLAKPVVFGELLSRLRAGVRVLEFERRLVEQRECDPTTGLPTTTALLAQIHERLAVSPTGSAGALSKLAKSTALVVVDIDFFRRLQRRLGRMASQKLAAAVGDRLRSSSNGQTWYSLGFDRFATLADQKSEKDAAEWAETWLRDLFHQELTWGTEKLLVSASAGVAELVPDQPPQKTLDRAVAALQLAKASGRGCAAASREVDEDKETWTQLAAGGNLFTSTRAGDVMIPCPVHLTTEDTYEQAQSAFDQTRLSAIPVVDADGRFAGIVTNEQMGEKRSRSAAKPRASGSVRLLKQVMVADVPKFEETATLSELMEFFTADGSPLAVIIRDRRPTGIVFCQALAALNERLTPRHFAPGTPYSQASDYLIVPDTTAAEAV
jgi:diguanylate cyclase (GGDEF)-like protein